MKAVAEKTEELDILDDPRPKDRVMWNRLRLALEAELCHRAWGCKLYELQRRGEITLDAMRGGDKYHQAVLDWRRWIATDPDEFVPEARQFIEGKIARAKRKIKDCTQVINPHRNGYVDAIVLYEEWPVLGWQRQRAIEALEDLGTFFAKGTKRKRKTP